MKSNTINAFQEPTRQELGIVKTFNTKESAPVKGPIHIAQKFRNNDPKVIALYNSSVNYFPEKQDDMSLNNYVAKVLKQESNILMPCHSLLNS